jgi:glycosyltransferase involved in cell wall biosynthesis
MFSPAPAALRRPLDDDHARGTRATGLTPERGRATLMTAQRHLLHVFPSFNIGGAQVRFAALVEGLGDRFRHTVISLTGNYDAAALLAPGSPVAFGEGLIEEGSLPARLGWRRAKVAELQPDLLLTYNWGAIESALANLFCGAPHIHMEDGFGPEEAHRQFARRIWTRRVALARSQVVVPSMTLRGIAARTWRLDMRKVHHIPNGIAPQTDYSTAIDSLGLDLPPALPRIVWAGALRREKNPIRLLRAFAPIKDKAVLLLIGDGPERQAILEEADRLAIGPHLRLLGRRTDARDLIMQCDILALSSDTEQMPLVVLEAMDAGLCVASVDVGDVRRMVAPANRPFITAVSEDPLAAALEALVADEGLRTRIGQANQAHLRENYDLQVMVDAYGALFDRTIAGRGRNV